MSTLLDLPDEILFHLVEMLTVPFDYRGYYLDPFWPLREKSSGGRNERGRHLRDLLALAATCRILRSKLGSIVWGDFVLYETMFRPYRSDDGTEHHFLDVFAASFVDTDNERYVNSPILEFVTVFEPHTPTAKLSMRLTDLYEYHTLELVNKKTLPILKRLIIKFYHHSHESYSDLVLRLQDYERPIKISASMTSADDLQHLQESFWSMVDHLVFTLTSSSNQNRDFSTLDTRVKNLRSLTLRSFVLDANSCAQLVRHLVTMINNNALETLDLVPLAMSFSMIKDLPLLEIPSLKRLDCQERHLPSFSRSPRSCRSLQHLKLKFDPDSILGNLDIPFQLATLCHLEIELLPYQKEPASHLPLFRKLQDTSPFLNSMCFRRLTISAALTLAPVLSKLKYFRADNVDYSGTYFWPRMTTEATTLATEMEHMHVNRMLSALILDEPTYTGKSFSLPVSPHELISYPLLKAIALDSRHAEPQISVLNLEATWPRISQFLDATQLLIRARFLREEYASFYSPFDFYDPISLKAVGHRHDQSYLQDLFYDFNDGHSFKLTDFCYVIHHVDSLWDPGSPESEDVPLPSSENYGEHSITMYVKIDLQRLKKLLTT